MQNKWVRGALFASAAAVLATALNLGATAAARAAEPYKASRTADGKADLNGVWQAVNTANWDLQEHVARTGLVVALGAVLGASVSWRAVRSRISRKRQQKRRRILKTG